MPWHIAVSEHIGWWPLSESLHLRPARTEDSGLTNPRPISHKPAMTALSIRNTYLPPFAKAHQCGLTSRPGLLCPLLEYYSELPPGALCTFTERFGTWTSTRYR